MANPYSIFKTDEKVEQEGVILDYGDFRVKIARAGGSNKKFGRLFSERLKPFKRQIEIEALDEAVGQNILIETYVDAVILDMDVLDKVNSKPDAPVYIQGILDPENNVLPYERKNVIAMLTNLPELFKDVQLQANSVALFRTIIKEEEIKNSQPLSIGI